MKALLRFLGAGAIAALWAFQPALAQQYPSRPIRILVPFAAGGLQDIEARELSSSIQLRSGAAVVVENKPGGGGVIGMGEVARAQPDGYTLLVAGASVTQIALFRKDVGFDPAKDLVPVSQLADGVSLIVTNKQTGAKDWPELMALAKSRPGKLNYASFGPGSVQLGMESLKIAAGIDLTEIPYAGQAAYNTALLRNDVQLVLGVGFKAMADAGDVIPLLAVGDKRNPQFPNIPTTTEAGYGRMIRSFGWVGLFAPGGTPAPILDRLAQEAAAFARSPDSQKRAAAAAIVLIGNSPEEFRRVFDADARTWAEIAKAIRLQPQ